MKWLRREPKALNRLRVEIFLIAVATNIAFYMCGLNFTWTVFFSGILFFLWEGDFKTRFWSVELGGLTGLLMAMGFLLGLTVLTPALGKLLGFSIPLSIALFLAIVLQPAAPLFFNNACFAYFSCACIAAEEFANHFGVALVTFLLGSPVYCGLCWLLLHKAVLKLKDGMNQDEARPNL